MLGPRTAIVALVMLGLFYSSFDSGWFGPEPAPPGISTALLVLCVLFGLGSWATTRTGDRKRGQMFAGLALAAGAYGLGRLVLG
jgi:hypothetical protein